MTCQKGIPTLPLTLQVPVLDLDLNTAASTDICDILSPENFFKNYPIIQPEPDEFFIYILPLHNK